MEITFNTEQERQEFKDSLFLLLLSLDLAAAGYQQSKNFVEKMHEATKSRENS